MYKAISGPQTTTTTTKRMQLLCRCTFYHIDAPNSPHPTQRKISEVHETVSFYQKELHSKYLVIYGSLWQPESAENKAGGGFYLFILY